MVIDLDYEGIEFSVSKKILAIFALTCFVKRVVWFILFFYLMKN